MDSSGSAHEINLLLGGVLASMLVFGLGLKPIFLALALPWAWLCDCPALALDLKKLPGRDINYEIT